MAKIGRELGIPLIMDNTAAPILCRPFEHGAAVIVYSTTKYIGGHGTSIGGLLVDGGNFPWQNHAERQPALNQPDPSYHGAVWVKAVEPIGPVAYIIKARTTLLRDLGSAFSPFNAFQVILGLETLPLRMREHCSNAQRVADFLSKHASVTNVIYPGIQDVIHKANADKYLSGGYGGRSCPPCKGKSGRGHRRSPSWSLEVVWHRCQCSYYSMPCKTMQARLRSVGSRAPP